MKTILTLKYGDKYTSDDVNRIYLDTNGKYNYVCVTDNPKGLHPNIYTISIDHEPDGHWEKVKLFQLNNLGKILYLDLDVSIQKDLDHLFNYLDKHPVICYTYWKPLEFPYHKDNRWSYNYLSNFLFPFHNVFGSLPLSYLYINSPTKKLYAQKIPI